jgi:hypothetical protein
LKSLELLFVHCLENVWFLKEFDGVFCPKFEFLRIVWFLENAWNAFLFIVKFFEKRLVAFLFNDWIFAHCLDFLESV